MKYVLMVTCLVIVGGSIATGQTNNNHLNASSAEEQEATPKLTDAERVDFLSNPRFDSKASVDKIATAASSIRLFISSLPDTKENHVQKQGAIFFLDFLSGALPDADYFQIEDTAYIRMPSVGSDSSRRLESSFHSYNPETKKVILKLVERVYTQLTAKWERLGFERPKGLIYIWLFPEIKEMRKEFRTGEHTAAFTVPCRFIVIPYSILDDIDEMLLNTLEKDSPTVRYNIERFLERSFQDTLAHELTHVFIASNLGANGISQLDKWFQEGMAIWLSNEDEQTLTSEYKDYKLAFDFMRMKYGNRQFTEFVQHTLQTKSSADSVKQQFGLSYEELNEKAGKWHSEARVWGRRLVLFTLAVLFLGCIAVFKWGAGAIGAAIAIILWASILFAWFYGITNLWANSATLATVFNVIAMIIVFGGLLIIGLVIAGLLVRSVIAYRR